MELRQNEKLENLGAGIKAITASGRTFGLDAVVLSAFAKPRKGYRVCDFGTGCGIIPLLWCRDSLNFTVDAVEIEPEAANAAQRSAACCRLETVIRVICDDYLTSRLLTAGTYDLIVCNPPYFKKSTGKISTSTVKNLARHENGLVSLSDIVARASTLLKHGGNFCLSLRPERLPELFALLQANSLEPKRLRSVQHNAHSRPSILLCESIKGAAPGLSMEPALLTDSPEMKQIFGDFNE